MRVSVTIDDELNERISELAKEKGMSKDKFLSSIIINYFTPNPRGAGRKSSLSHNTICEIKDCFEKGMSKRSIARRVGLSVTYVSNILEKYNSTHFEG